MVSFYMDRDHSYMTYLKDYSHCGGGYLYIPQCNNIPEVSVRICQSDYLGRWAANCLYWVTSVAD